MGKKISNKVYYEQHTYLHLIKINQFLGIPQKAEGLSTQLQEVTPSTTQFQGHSEIVLKIPLTTFSVSKWEKKKGEQLLQHRELRKASICMLG